MLDDPLQESDHTDHNDGQKHNKIIAKCHFDKTRNQQIIDSQEILHKHNKNNR